MHSILFHLKLCRRYALNLIHFKVMHSIYALRLFNFKVIHSIYFNFKLCIQFNSIVYIKVMHSV